jgi:hypothetical protein
MFLVSLIKPTVYARWFSFLVPFDAMFVAFGIVETARRVAARRVVLLAALVVGVLSCSVPVFAQYYFDPGFRPSRWRMRRRWCAHPPSPRILSSLSTTRPRWPSDITSMSRIRPSP